MTIHEAQRSLTEQLTTIYDAREAANIADWVMEHLTGWKKIDRIVHKTSPLSAEQESRLVTYTPLLLAHTPVQYVLHEAWFAGMQLYVDEHVLIPRPETEELVEWVESGVRSERSEVRSQKSAAGSSPFSILDVGTGSGCIPIALKKKLPAAMVHACDVSEGALEVARRNAETQQVAIEWHLLDFLDTAHWALLPSVNIIVSNPPYIPLKDKETMHDNVLLHEPHLALFVENNDPLLFYRTIAAFAKERLLPGGSIYVEIHEDLGPATQELFKSYGFSEVELKKDMQGKDRMVKASH
jgi:release factor glutamine methyltransferase